MSMFATAKQCSRRGMSSVMARAQTRSRSSKASGLTDLQQRSLINLHHQCPSFVTNDNLEDVVRDTFTASTEVSEGIMTKLRINDLKEMATYRENAPAFIQPQFIGVRHNPGGPDTVFGGVDRATRIRDALLGSETVGDEEGLPGKEVAESGDFERYFERS